MTIKYIFMQEQKSCYYRNDTVGATLSGYKFLERGNEEKLKEAVAIIGPISVGIDASLASFQSYHRGCDLLPKIFFKYWCIEFLNFHNVKLSFFGHFS